MIVKIRHGKFEVSVAGVRSSDEAASLISLIMQKVAGEPEKVEETEEHKANIAAVFEQVVDRKVRAAEKAVEKKVERVVPPPIETSDDASTDFDPEKLEAKKVAPETDEPRDVTPDIEEMAKMPRLAFIIKYLVNECGYRTEKQVIDTCVEIREFVPVLKTIDRQMLKKRVAETCARVAASTGLTLSEEQLS